MSAETVDRIIDWIGTHNMRSVDITGGAPELNPHFRRLVEACRKQDVAVTSRCNLTVLEEPGQEDTASWYATNNVRLVCSLPCYSEINVDSQRGKGVFEKSIRMLQTLNALGYGDTLQLDLMYNPGGAFLPPSQPSLEHDYRKRLLDDFGIRFSSLLVLSNLPISRFAHYLERTGQCESYMQLLKDNFNPDTLDGLMCRHLVSVDWQGRVYDCDFNQILGLGLGYRRNTRLWDIDPDMLYETIIATDSHCLGCTAGAGSSCGGSLA